MAQRDFELREEFRDAADRFVTRANELGADRAHDWVRTVMMYATSRDNVLSWLTRDEDPGQTADEAANHFAGEYRTMFRESLKELEPVYRASGEPGRRQ
jgi:hypothetical protein